MTLEKVEVYKQGFDECPKCNKTSRMWVILDPVEGAGHFIAICTDKDCNYREEGSTEL